MGFLGVDIGRWYESDAAVQEYEAAAEIKDAEPAILRRMQEEGLGTSSFLDLGVGGGRTTVHFAPNCAEYVGADYSPPLVAACERRFASSGWDHVRFEVADARDLSRWEDGRFGFTLFSVNGIDAVGDLDGRMRALREIRRVTQDGGLFAFSAHNLQWVPGAFALGTSAVPLVRALLLRLHNLRLGDIARREHAVVADHRIGFRYAKHFFVRPREQLRQLRQAGFAEAAVLARDGSEIPESALDAHTPHWTYYLCRA